MKYCFLIRSIKKSVILICLLSSTIAFGQKVEQPSTITEKHEKQNLQVSDQRVYPFQNPDMPIEDRVSNIVSLMTLDEKVAFLSQRPSVERLGIKGMGHVEGLHGLAQGTPGGWGRRGVITTTTFPQSYGMGETWDPEMISQSGAIEGIEARYVFQSPK